MLDPNFLKPMFDQYKGFIVKFLLDYVSKNKDQLNLQYTEHEDSLEINLKVDRSLFTDDDAYNEILELLAKAQSQSK